MLLIKLCGLLLGVFLLWALLDALSALVVPLVAMLLIAPLFNNKK